MPAELMEQEQDTAQDAWKPLKLPRQERFCELLAQDGAIGTKAYQQAYSAEYDTARANASNLLAKPSVQARIAYLKARNQSKPLSLETKKRILAEMVNGVRPTRKVVLPDGGTKLTHEYLGALELAAKIDGELGSEGSSVALMILDPGLLRALLPPGEQPAKVIDVSEQP